jgi:hypothetical protein
MASILKIGLGSKGEEIVEKKFSLLVVSAVHGHLTSNSKSKIAITPQFGILSLG